jgi:hypothetical protein
MRFTPYMAACSQQLTERGEYPTDHSIDSLVKVYALNAKIPETLGYFDADKSEFHGVAAMQFAVSSLSRELHSIQDQAPRQFSDEGALLYLEGLVTEAWFSEIALHDRAWSTGGASTAGNARPSQATNATTNRIRMLFRLIDENSRVFQAFVSFTDKSRTRLTFTAYSQISYTLMSQARAAATLFDALQSNPPREKTVQAQWWQTMPTRKSLDRVGYSKSCLDVISALESPLPASSADALVGIDVMRRLGVLTRSMMSTYARELQKKIGVASGLVQADASAWQAYLNSPSAGNGDGARGHVPSSPACAPAVEHVAGGPSSEGGLVIGYRDVVDKAVEFDEKTWAVMLRELKLPTRAARGPFHWPVG